MIETTDLAFVVSIRTSTVYIQIVERYMHRTEDQGENQHQSYEMCFCYVVAECFAQHAAIVPYMTDRWYLSVHLLIVRWHAQP